MTREEAIEKLERNKAFMCHGCMHPQMIGWCEDHCQMPEAIDMAIEALKSEHLSLRERALMLLLNWAVECGFGYDNFPEEYERYKDEIEDMSYFDGMIYIAEKEVERNE